MSSSAPRSPSPLARQGEKPLSPEQLRGLARKVILTRLEGERCEREGLLPPPLPVSSDSGDAQVRIPAVTPEDLAPHVVPGAPPPPFEATELSASVEPLPAETSGLPRTRVKLRLYRLETVVAVELDAASGAVMSWRDSERTKERGDRELSSAEAAEIASRSLALPEDCGTPDVVLRTNGPVPTFEVSWVHLTGPDGDVVVEGDKIIVRVNGTTGRVHSIFRKWRRVPETPSAE